MTDPHYTLLDTLDGRFSLDGKIIKTASAITAGNYNLPIRATDEHGWSKDFTVSVPVFEGRAKTGDIVFGPQADTGSLVGGMLTPGATNKVLCGSTYLPDLPQGWRMLFWNFSCISSGQSPIERLVGNTNEVKWLSVLAGVAGARIANGDATFADFGGGSGVMADGGFLITDGLPAVAAGAYARWLLETPAGGKRPQTYGLNYNARGQNAGAASVASRFDAIRAGGAIAGGDGSVFNNEATQAAGLLMPAPEGYRSMLLIGTSIMRNQDSETRYLQSVDPVRNVYAHFPVGLDHTPNRMGWAMMAVNGASIAQQSVLNAGAFGLRYASLKAIATKNGGRWPFTDIVLDFRNDVVQSDSLPSLTATINDMRVRIQSGITAIKALFPGLPVHACTLPTIQVSGSLHFWTSLASQAPLNFKATAIPIVNEWLRTDHAALGLASACDIAGDMVTVDGDNAKWPIAPFTLAGGGTLDVADYPTGLAIGTNLSTTGVKIKCPAGVTPEIGAVLVFEAGETNSELVTGSIISATLVSGSTYLVKVAAGATTKLHAAATSVKTTLTKDGTHPVKWLQDKTGLGAVVAWKATI